MKSILDRAFLYTPSFATDVRKTFARIREQRRAAGLAGKVVLPLRRLATESSRKS